jgi:hypothetical protein
MILSLSEEVFPMNRIKNNHFMIITLLLVFLFVSNQTTAETKGVFGSPNLESNLQSNSMSEVQGFIKAVTPKDKKLIINGEDYYLANDSQIKRNGYTATLKSCSPITEGIYQWAEAKIVDHKIVSLKVTYQVKEGTVRNVDSINNYLYIDVYNTPEVKGGLQKLGMVKSIIGIMSNIKKGDKITVGVSDDTILYLFNLNQKSIN